MRQDSRSGCPVATTLDIVGDRWTLVILRDMLNGKRRFSQFLDSPERITTNALTDWSSRWSAPVSYRKRLTSFIPNVSNTL